MSQDSHSFGLPRSERAELIRRIQELEERCRRAEDALRTLEDRNRLLGDSAPFGILVLETEGRVYGANQKILKMLAWPSDQDVTELNLLQYPPLVDSGVADSFRLCLEKKRAFSAIISVSSTVVCMKAKLQKDRKFKARVQHIESNVLKGQT